MREFYVVKSPAITGGYSYLRREDYKGHLAPRDNAETKCWQWVRGVESATKLERDAALRLAELVRKRWHMRASTQMVLVYNGGYND